MRQYGGPGSFAPTFTPHGPPAYQSPQSDPPSHNATPKLIHRDLEYGSIDAEAPLDRADSGVEVSPIEPPSGYTYRQQYRIIPPRISGHGRLIAARRTVPYWIGLVSVVGAFAWAVLCAIYIYRLGGG